MVFQGSSRKAILLSVRGDQVLTGWEICLLRIRVFVHQLIQTRFPIGHYDGVDPSRRGKIIASGDKRLQESTLVVGAAISPRQIPSKNMDCRTPPQVASVSSVHWHRAESIATVASMIRHKGGFSWHTRWRKLSIPDCFQGIALESYGQCNEKPLVTKCAMRRAVNNK
jgi:hypothetical protein